MANTNIPQIDDPYVGKVYGNLLDNYLTPTYNVKLYMLKKEESVAAPDEVASTTFKKPSPENMIILAQTGVTATTIDDLTIEALRTTEAPNAIQINFTVHQPGAATFLDQMQLARAHLKQENDYMPIVFLEIRFQGYEGPTFGENDDEDTGGEFWQSKSYRWKLAITGIQVAINSEGSQYDFTAVPTKSIAFTSPLFKIPTNLSTVGKTITEHVKSLETQLNTYHSETAADNGVPDEFTFDLSELLAGTEAGAEGENTLASDEDDTTIEGSSTLANPDGTVDPGRIQDETLLTSADPEADDRNRQMNETYAVGDAVTAKQAFVDAPLDEGEEPEQVFEEDKIHIPKDMTIEKFFATLLSMNQEFYHKISRKVPIDDPKAEAKTEQAYVYWFKMDANITQLGFDKKRNGYAHKVVYKPRMYKSSRPDIIVDSKEATPTKEDYKNRAKEIFENGGIRKAYHYIFSGLNDQILNLDIKYDTGIALMIPPLGGAIGQASVVLAEKAGGIDRGKDVTLGGVVENLIEAKADATAKDVFKDFMDSINNLKDIASDGLSGLVQQLEDATGLDNSIITGALQDNNEANQQALELALTKNSDALKEINAQNQINNAAVEPFPEYDPELSGYNYSVDLVNRMETPLTATELENLGYLLTDEDIGTLNAKVVSSEGSDAYANQAATIKKGSVQNTLFGVVASQHENDLAFLLQLEMTLRGDPWYLGKDTNDNSDEEACNFFKDDSHFYLSLRSPKTFDMDWRDEDSPINTGYWKGDGEARTFGGVYRLISVTNNFSNGEYTVDVNAQRVVPAQDPVEAATTGEAGGTSGGTG